MECGYACKDNGVVWDLCFVIVNCQIEGVRLCVHQQGLVRCKSSKMPEISKISGYSTVANV